MQMTSIDDAIRIVVFTNFEYVYTWFIQCVGVGNDTENAQNTIVKPVDWVKFPNFDQVLAFQSKTW